MKKKLKYSLMGLVATSAIIIPTVAVVSCAEITKNAATNTYYAFSTVDAFSGNATNSEINAIALGKNNLNNKDCLHKTVWRFLLGIFFHSLIE